MLKINSPIKILVLLFICIIIPPLGVFYLYKLKKIKLLIKLILAIFASISHLIYFIIFLFLFLSPNVIGGVIGLFLLVNLYLISRFIVDLVKMDKYEKKVYIYDEQFNLFKENKSNYLDQFKFVNTFEGKSDFNINVNILEKIIAQIKSESYFIEYSEIINYDIIIFIRIDTLITGSKNLPHFCTCLFKITNENMISIQTLVLTKVDKNEQYTSFVNNLLLIEIFRRNELLNKFDEFSFLDK